MMAVVLESGVGGECCQTMLHFRFGAIPPVTADHKQSIMPSTDDIQQKANQNKTQ